VRAAATPPYLRTSESNTLSTADSLRASEHSLMASYRSRYNERGSSVVFLFLQEHWQQKDIIRMIIIITVGEPPD